MSGTLYIVATPIGNLDEITFRALETLKSVDLILCEDTAHSAKLLNRYGIKAEKLSYHKFNEAARLEGILENLKAGKNIALISDAGMPAISDPGEKLVAVCRREGMTVNVISGACALVNAFAMSGLSAPFTFLGFLPDKNKDRQAFIAPYINSPSSLIFYCAPHDVKKTLEFLYLVLGARKAVICRELTKLHEEAIDFVLGGEINFTLLGEFVIITEGAPPKAAPELSAEEQLAKYLAEGIPKKEAVKRVAIEHGVPRNEIYQLALKIFK